ncbi:hypothetical protein [Vibrio genomosp. F10]|uniref:hypothetical protein n=1 Tax=Vibrio genomosp. F10 TaxID=723171 RepID=UPI0003770887|nr:hypothetical protein [Vibrio genomosp. F10]OEF06918.1 MSHA biogenesis protein MshI [Vibrio genomosp. F10 str. 9ZB36]
MNIKSLIDKLRPTKKQHSNLLAIVEPDAIYFSKHSVYTLPKIALDHGHWPQALATHLKTHSVENVTVSVVLNSSLYQTFQIDTPNVPQEELSIALPFLLKDLVTEKVTDIVADAFTLPSGNKTQAYVIKKSLITELTHLLAEQKCSLDEVLTEDDLWGIASSELSSYLLLQRSVKGSYKICAFHEGKCVFQRTIRNVVSPLTGTASSDFQLDGMALELQRSIDYLSSQLKGVPLHTLFTSCDEEEQQELAEALDERLNVKVKPLSTELIGSGDLLAVTATHLMGDHINLYPEHLRPQKQYFTFQNAATSWVLVAALLLACSGYYHYSSLQLKAELKLQQQQSAQLAQQAQKLREQLEKHKPSPEKVAAVARLKDQIQSHNRSLNAIGDYNQSQRQGYAGVMGSLANIGRNDISLVSIRIDNQKLNLQGLAKNAETVPNWVHQFREELNLVGRSFEKLKIGRNEQDVITFELRTQEDVK